MFSKKSHNVINLITRISVFGIAVSTAALVIVLSAFNGIENLVITLFSTFEPDIKIESAVSKSFDEKYVPESVYQVDGLVNHSRVIEEIAIIKNDEMFIIGNVKGVEEPFLEMCDMESPDHLVDGRSTLGNGQQPLGMVGVIALQNLSGYIYESTYPQETFTIYSPNREKTISRTSVSAFTTSRIPIVGTFTFNNDVDETYLLVPLYFADSILNYKGELTAIEMDFEEGVDVENKKEELSALLGDSFKVKTNYEQNALIYQTSKSEKWITTLLLAFIFFLATFNMIASITMLVIEKKDNMRTLRALGAEKNQLRQIFFYDGLLINGLGLVIGLLVGYGVCLAQQTFKLIKLEGSVIDHFPVVFKLQDLFVILAITVLFGLLAAYIPSRFLVKRIIE